jgi:hypothetical protein
MHWETPTFIETDMNAEIGGYQGDDGDPYEPILEAAGAGTDLDPNLCRNR